MWTGAGSEFVFGRISRNVTPNVLPLSVLQGGYISINFATKKNSAGAHHGLVLHDSRWLAGRQRKCRLAGPACRISQDCTKQFHSCETVSRWAVLCACCNLRPISILMHAVVMADSECPYCACDYAYTTIQLSSAVWCMIFAAKCSHMTF